MPPKVSFLIPLYNEASDVRGMLQSILDQDYPQDAIEVLIALAPSSDGTEQIVEKFARQNPSLQIVVVANPDLNTALGRNLCLAKAAGDLVMNFSGHAIADANLLSVLVAKISALPDEVAGVGCSIRSSGGSTRLGRAIATVMSSSLGGVRSVDSSYTSACDGPARSTAFTLYRATVLRELDGFDAGFWCGQDAELNLRLAKHGYQLWFTPDTGVQHRKRARLSDFIRQIYRYGVARAKLTKKYPDSVRVVFLMPSLFLIGVIGAVVASYSSSLAQGITLAGAGLFLVTSVLSALFARGDIMTLLISPLLYFLLYISYGIGFLRGWLP